MPFRPKRRTVAFVASRDTLFGVRRSFLWAFLATTLASHPPQVASACQCAREALEVWPHSGTRAPTNTRILIVVPRNTLFRNAPSKPQRPFVLKRKGGKEVPTKLRVLWSGEITLYQLIPQKQLVPSGTYQVTVQHAAERPSLLTQFRTEEKADNKPPSAPRVMSAHVTKAEQGSCATQKRYVEIRLSKAVARTQNVRFSIWLVEPEATINYDSPAKVIWPAWSDKLVLGQPSQCAASNFVLPKTGKRRIGIRATDLAGNASEPTEVVVQF